MAPRPVWAQRAVRLWVLSHSYLTRHARDRVPHVAPHRFLHGDSVPAIPGWGTPVEKRRLDIQWHWPVSPAHHRHGQGSPETWCHPEKLWQVWCWMLMCVGHWLTFHLTLASTHHRHGQGSPETGSGVIVRNFHKFGVECCHVCWTVTHLVRWWYFLFVCMCG